MNKTIAGAIVGAVVIAAASFYAGTVYAKQGRSPRGQFGNEAGQFMQRAGGSGPGGARMMGGFTTGEIIAKDDSSITIKMPDGSTKLVLVGEKVQVMKLTEGTAVDLGQGINVMVTGETNSDGSVTAQTIQIRPADSLPPGTRPPMNE